MTRAIYSFVAMIILAVVPWQTSSAQLKTLVMPGDVIEGHAELEAECNNCHEAFARERQPALCLDCHDDVASDVNGRSGFHGLFDEARESNCANCHTDHEGRSAEIVVLNKSSFDHIFTDFRLHGLHIETPCQDCHTNGEKYRDAPLTCNSCHQEDSVHDGTLGDECADCHSATGWMDVEFDHETTGYSLLGEHAQTDCLDCHADQTFQAAPVACVDCHLDDDVHEGKSGPECGNCHNPIAWSDTSFDHTRDTQFPIDGAHADLSCGGCHSDEPFSDDLDAACVACHLEDDSHDTHFGGDCENCHTTSEWPDVTFDHTQDAGYELLANHAIAACEDCHIEPIFEVALDVGCNSCHADDDPHEGTQGQMCTDCHSESGWTDNVFFDHDLTAFPLLGAHGEQACEDCHVSQVFKDASIICIDCHVEDDPHADRFGSECGACHNPVSWDAWLFDHDAQTEFPLLGAHAAVECDDCHRKSLTAQLRIGNRCADCHRTDDVHDGEFGSDCGRCHTVDSFRDVRSIR